MLSFDNDDVLSMSRCWDKVSKALWLPRNILGLDAGASGSHGPELHKSQETTVKVLTGCAAYLWATEACLGNLFQRAWITSTALQNLLGTVNDLDSQPSTASFFLNKYTFVDFFYRE